MKSTHLSRLVGHAREYSRAFRGVGVRFLWLLLLLLLAVLGCADLLGGFGQYQNQGGDGGAPTSSSGGSLCSGSTNECVLATCVDGNTQLTNKAPGVICDNGARHCDGNGHCVECTKGSECVSGLCGQVGDCLPASCGDGIENGHETDKDCGGPECDPCPLGLTCTAGTDCTSGFCADDICCDEACTGECVACSNEKKGKGADGACGPVAADTDPDDECEAQAQDTCGNDTGNCNGESSCSKFPYGLPCGISPFCAANTQKSQDYCDGLGACVDGGMAPCEPYLCDGDVCGTTCGSDADCTATSYCDMGQCVPHHVEGTACSAGNECASSFCVDGVCCNNACDQPCRACNISPNVGSCSLVAKYEQDTFPSNACTVQYACDGAGACKKALGQSCFSNGDCVNNLCDNLTCGKALGKGCNNSEQCTSLQCVDGYCCNSPCTDPCRTCAGDMFDGFSVATAGICGNIASHGEQSDPNGGCAFPKACSPGGSCAMANAQPCGAGCASGLCVKGICCSSFAPASCNDTFCKYCPSGDSCVAIPAGTDPYNECPGALSCNGSGSCQ